MPSRRSQATRPAEIVRELGPLAEHVNGVTFDGKDVWFAAGDRLQAVAPESGELGRSLPVPAEAGTAFDGRFLYQLAAGRIQKIDPESGRVLSSVPSPGGSGQDSGLTWAEGSLWVGQHRDRKIHRVDPETGAVLRTLESARFVTGVTFLDGDLWHGTWENDESDLRRLDPETGELLEVVTMPAGTYVSGLEADARGRFFCGGGKSGKIRVVR